VTTFLLAGRWFEARARRDAGDAMRELAAAGAREASVLDGDGTDRRVPAGQLRAGDRVVVRPGEVIAADGVEFGESAVDTSVMTGESVPAEVTAGASVTAGTVVMSGRLIVRAARTGQDTQLAHLIALVEHAQTGKSGVQRLADRICGVFVPAALAAATLTLVGWLAAGSPALAVLIIACPHRRDLHPGRHPGTRRSLRPARDRRHLHRQQRNLASRRAGHTRCPGRPAHHGRQADPGRAGDLRAAPDPAPACSPPGPQTQATEPCPRRSPSTGPTVTSASFGPGGTTAIITTGRHGQSITPGGSSWLPLPALPSGTAALARLRRYPLMPWPCTAAPSPSGSTPRRCHLDRDPGHQRPHPVRILKLN
jgi:E1-E2 ATPase